MVPFPILPANSTCCWLSGITAGVIRRQYERAPVPLLAHSAAALVQLVLGTNLSAGRPIAGIKTGLQFLERPRHLFTFLAASSSAATSPSACSRGGVHRRKLLLLPVLRDYVHRPTVFDAFPELGTACREYSEAPYWRLALLRASISTSSACPYPY